MTRAPKSPDPPKPPRRGPPRESTGASSVATPATSATPATPATPATRSATRPGTRRGADGPRRLGDEGESLAARFLTDRGYRIVGRNVRADRVEIDLVARRGPLLVFVEVKSRRSERHGSAAEAVDPRKQQRLRRGAVAWLATRPPDARGTRRVRMDVVLCRPERGRSPRSEGDRRSHVDRSAHAGPETGWLRGEDGTRWRVEHWRNAF